jgi:hypothetical protein
MWKSFPVTAQPRPLVLTVARILDPPTGFVTGDQKLAYGSGQFALATTLPAAPPTSGGYAIVAAKAALEQLRSSSDGSGMGAVSPLRITAITLGRATFGTDRGQRLLPAWRLTLAGVSGAAQVLAVAPSQLWPPKPLPVDPWDKAAIAADDQSITYSFLGSPSNCIAHYAGKLAESRTAAVLSVREITARPVSCPAVGVERTVTVHLSEPLGNRVLLTAQGSPIPVQRR